MGAGGSTITDGEVVTLQVLVTRSQVLGHHFVVVPDRVAGAAGKPPGAHPRHWIALLDGRRPACGEAQRLVNVNAELWCLKPECHRGEHW